MASDWNLLMERWAATPLTGEEGRLLAALARLLLGWRKRSDRISVRQLRDVSHLHGRSFERARAGLIEKGLIRYTPGESGRGHGAYYELVLEEEETSAHHPPRNVRTYADV